MLKRIYNTIRSKNFIYFLREVEFRRSLKGLNNYSKLVEFSNMFACVGIKKFDEYLSEKDLLSLEYETNFDD